MGADGHTGPPPVLRAKWHLLGSRTPRAGVALRWTGRGLVHPQLVQKRSVINGVTSKEHQRSQAVFKRTERVRIQF